MSEPSTSSAALLLSHDAHALRNHVATLRSIVQLIDEPEVAQALDDSSRALQVALERAIVLSRVELDDRPAQVSLGARELVRLAIGRARREGAQVTEPTPSDGDDVLVDVPGPWAERLVADLLHHAERADTVLGRDGDVATLAFKLASPMPEPLDLALARLATACGGSLVLRDDAAELRLPIHGA